ncbi:mucoidy inhibitor MuiA family protein [Salinisphaera sp. P385]|uniref:Mucoidy inhibitor MuiA family protein n=1 Tax=Spectribacter acetivorans TaxID=3075603 RepID=A0ABU3B7P6_9GAMM|nr:mucoidy inhibitor MuiA family protein [Salinisphaera sp. P385]MDT0618490.1 mucoidy inhibitor MuiA family protein [Salinisphaera sp. P385]
MITRLVLALTATFTLGAATASQGTITQVLALPDSAQITRSLELSVVKGVNPIRLGPFPAAMDPDSIQIELSGTGLSLGSITPRRLHQAEFSDALTKTLRTRLEQVQQAIQALQDRALALERRESFITQMAAAIAAPAEGQPLLPPSNWDDAANRLQSQIEEVYVRRRELEQNKQDREEDQAKIQAELSSYQNRARSVQVVDITLDSDAQRSAEIVLRYRVNGARWQPRYRAHLDSHSHQLRLELIAELTQSTGEDWPGVSLRVATQRSDLGTRPPSLSPWLVSAAPRITPQQALRETRALAASDFAGSQPETATASPRLDGFSLSYEVPGPTDVRSDNDPVGVSLATWELDATVTHRAAPRRLPAAFVHARTAMPETSALLPGPVELYRDQSYIGRTRIEQAQDVDGLSLSFGADDTVKVTYEAGPATTEDVGMLRRQQQASRTHLIRITNHHGRSIRLVLLDQVPVARDDTVTIANQYQPRPPEPYNEKLENGLIVWRETIAPDASFEAKVDTTLTYEPEARLQGWPD